MSLVRQQEVHWRGPDGVHATTAALDLSSEGTGSATCPRDLLLTSVAGCYAVALPTTLQRMRLDPRHVRVLARGTLGSDPIRGVFETIEIMVWLEAEGNPERLGRATRLALGRACPVARMLAESSALSVVLHRGDERIGPFSWTQCAHSDR